MANSINTNISAYYAQANITQAADAASSSVARLSSGNRIVKASDDVAALATGTSLLSTVSALRAAQVNSSQGSSLLQVADGALAQIQNILQQQKSIALQAGSGSLTNTDRGFLNQQFQALADEINSLSGSTTFNGVNLIDGSLSTGAIVQGATTQATAGNTSLNFTGNISANETVIVNGITLTAKASPSAATEFQIGLTTAETVANLATKLTSLSQTTTYATTLGQATYTAVGNSLQFESRTGGLLDKTFTINANGTATAYTGAAIGGEFGDSSFNIFATGFASATSAVSAATAAAATPFQDGDGITLDIGSASSAVLHTVVAGDTLTSIVTGINARKAITGVTASLTFDPTAQTYNISLAFKNTSSDYVEFDAGANYNGGTFGLTGILQGGTDNETQLFSASQNLFAANLTAANITDENTDITDTGATAAEPLTAGDVIKATLNGGTAVTLYTIAANDTLQDIIDGINANSSTSGVGAELVEDGGTSFNIKLLFNGSQTGLTLSHTAAVHATAAAAAASTAVITGNPLTQTVKVGLSGGTDSGLGLGTTSVSGTVGDSLVTGLSQNTAKVTISFPDVAADALTNAGNFNSDGSVYLSIGGKLFAFTTTAAANKAADEITIGATLKDTLDNAVNTINTYLSSGIATGDVAYQLSQLNIYRDGNNLVIEGKGITNPTTIDGAAASTIAITGFSNGAPVSNSGLLNNASNVTGGSYGVDVNGVSNSAFIGTVTGFTASYVSANTTNLSVKVGSYTYTATNVPTNNTSNQTIRFFSDTLADGTNGGYFDVQLAANEGQVVTNQTDANTFAQRLNGVFNSLKFGQERNLASYNGNQTIVANDTLIGSLIGSKVSAQLPSFSFNKLSEVSVTNPSTTGGDAVIQLTIDGVKYQTAVGLGSKLGANQTYRLTSAANPNAYVDFTTGNSAIDLSTAENARAAQSALAAAFGAGNGSAALSFQIGATTNDTIKVSIGSSKTSSLYGGKTLSVATQSGAAEASSVLDSAINAVTALRAGVGALLSQFNFASAAIQSSVQNQDAARGQLLDTDIAIESTAYATSQVKLQAGISVLAQANQSLQALLKLIG
jgi:flagellin